MAGGKRTKEKSPSAPRATDASANETTDTTTTTIKRRRTGTSNNDQHEPILSGAATTENDILGDDNVTSASVASIASNASIATDIESSNNTTTIMVNGSAPVGTPADIDITIEQKLPTKEQLAVSTYQINMFLHLFLCCLIFHRVHCVFFKI
jgi:hypothetical protein